MGGGGEDLVLDGLPILEGVMMWRWWGWMGLYRRFRAPKFGEIGESRWEKENIVKLDGNEQEVRWYSWHNESLHLVIGIGAVQRILRTGVETRAWHLLVNHACVSYEDARGQDKDAFCNSSCCLIPAFWTFICVCSHWGVVSGSRWCAKWGTAACASLIDPVFPAVSDNHLKATANDICFRIPAHFFIQNFVIVSRRDRCTPHPPPWRHISWRRASRDRKRPLRSRDVDVLSPVAKESRKGN